MWILPKQLHTSAYVADTKGLGQDSEEFSQTCERSLTWRGKDSLQRTWLQRWKRESWMQHLSSRTLKHSRTESFVDAWTSSLGDSRANLSAKLEFVKGLKIPGISSLTSETGSESADLELFSSKTLKELSQAKHPMENQFSNMSSENWKDWVTSQRQEYSQRVKSAHLIRESVSLSWGTPSTMDVLPPRSPEALARAKKKGGCKNLREEVVNWPTATTRDFRDGMNLQKVIRKDGKHRLDSIPRLLQVVTYGYPDQTNPNTNGKNRGSLNPNWVEQLMGIPVGWTDLGSWATESSQPQPPKPSLPLSKD